MPVTVTLPPTRVEGGPAPAADINQLVTAIAAIAAFANTLETSINTISTTYLKGRVQPTEPTHDGSQVDDELWIVE